MLTNVLKDYRAFFRDGHRQAAFMAVLFFAFAIIVQTVANNYVGQVTSVSVPDLILDHVTALNIGGLIIDAVLLVTAITIVLGILHPRCFAFGLKALSLFIIIRAVMISLTHLGANPHQLFFNPNDFGYGIYNILYNTTNDFFFSAHTGAPFLVALVFWQEKEVRYFYILVSVLFGVSVLLAHIHYSIDVFAAPFMTYGIFHVAKELFKKDYAFSRRHA